MPWHVQYPVIAYSLGSDIADLANVGTLGLQWTRAHRFDQV